MFLFSLFFRWAIYIVVDIHNIYYELGHWIRYYERYVFRYLFCYAREDIFLSLLSLFFNIVFPLFSSRRWLLLFLQKNIYRERIYIFLFGFHTLIFIIYYYIIFLFIIDAINYCFSCLFLFFTYTYAIWYLSYYYYIPLYCLFIICCFLHYYHIIHAAVSILHYLISHCI